MSKQKISETEFQKRCGNWVAEHVQCCLSHVVSTIGKAYWDSPHLSEEYDGEEIIELFRQPDWYRTLDEQVDRDSAEVKKFLTYEPWDTFDEFLNEALEGMLIDAFYQYFNNGSIDILEDEIYEHWAVDDHAAYHLKAQGCQVSDIFPMINLWCRGTTGQAILLDYAIRQIVSELYDIESNGKYL